LIDWQQVVPATETVETQLLGGGRIGGYEGKGSAGEVLLWNAALSEGGMFIVTRL
jgi:hypothetical protein